MNNVIGWLLGTLVAFLAGWAGLQKHKVSNAEKRAEEAEEKARRVEVKLKVSETASKVKDEIVAGQKANQGQKESVDLQIAETEKKEDPDGKGKDQERIANGITDLFNARNSAQ